MAGASCATCGRSIGKGMHCEACAGVAATMVANAAPTIAAVNRKGGKHDPLIGVEVIGQYVIRSLLGKGGMGAVYLADQPSVSRTAVIKVLHPVHSRDPDTKTRFETEARAASQLNHPNIVTIYNYGAMADGTLFLAMEYLDGQTLEHASAKRPLPLERVVNVVGQIADALGEAHRRGVVHRDVKPTNVMLVTRGQVEDFVKVLDFGIAYVDGARLTSTGEVCGTPTYMSPEQIRGKGVDGRSDLYSLGCVLFELVTGQPPFSGGNSLGLAYKHVNDPPPRASEVAPKARVSAALDAFLACTLAKDPADRPRTAEEFRDELRAAASAATAPTRAEPRPAAPRAETRPAAPRAETKPAAPRAETKPEAKSEPATKPAPPSKRGDGAVKRSLARVTTVLRGTGSLFRRRKSLRERVMARVRGLGRRTRRRNVWAWVIAGAVILSALGVGWLVVGRSDQDRPAAAAPAKPSRPPAKPARAKRSVDH